MTDVEPLFIGTNILIYANVIETPFHQQALATINAAHKEGRTIWISPQVLREYWEIFKQAASRSTTPISWPPCWLMTSPAC